MKNPLPLSRLMVMVCLVFSLNNLSAQFLDVSFRDQNATMKLVHSGQQVFGNEEGVGNDLLFQYTANTGFEQAFTLESTDDAIWYKIYHPASGRYATITSASEGAFVSLKYDEEYDDENQTFKFVKQTEADRYKIHTRFSQGGFALVWEVYESSESVGEPISIKKNKTAGNSENQKFDLSNPATSQFTYGGVYAESDLASKAFHITNKTALALLGTVNGEVQTLPVPDYGPTGVFVFESGPDDGQWWTSDLRWFLVRSLTDGGYFTVDNANPGGLVTLENKRTGTAVETQQFRLVGAPQASGWYKLRSRTGNLVLEVRTDGRLIVDTPQAGAAPQQKFAINLDYPDNGGVRYAVVGNKHHDYLSDKGFIGNDVEPKRIRRADPSIYWHFIPTSTPNGYRIQNALTKQYLFNTGNGYTLTNVLVTNTQSLWILSTPSNSEKVQIQSAYDFSYVGTPPLSEDIVPQEYFQDNTLWLLYRIEDEEPEIPTRTFDEIADEPLPDDCLLFFGEDFKRGLAERVGLPAAATHFPFIQAAVAYHTGLSGEALSDYIQKIDLQNRDHRTILALAVRRYIAEDLAYRPRGTWSTADEAAVSIYEQRISANRIDYANRLDNSYDDFVNSSLGTNDGSVTMSFFVESIDASSFLWPSQYKLFSPEQSQRLNDFIVAGKEYQTAQPIVDPAVPNLLGAVSGMGVSIGIQAALNIAEAGTAEVLTVLADVIVAKTGSTALGSFTSTLLSGVGAVVSVITIATDILVHQILSTIDVIELGEDLQNAIDWASAPVYIDQTMQGNNIVYKLKMLDDLDFAIAIPVPNQQILNQPIFNDYLYNNNDNVYEPAFSLPSCNNTQVSLGPDGYVFLSASDLIGNVIVAPYCGGPITYSFSQNYFNCSNLGETTVTMTASNSKLSLSCQATVTIVEDTAPVARCQDITVQLDANGQAEIEVADIDDGSFDACGVASKTIAVNSFDCSNIGNNAVLLTVTDVNSNIGTCTAQVEVEDNVAPTAQCKNLTIYLDEFGQRSITGADVDNGSSDACGVASLSLSRTDFDCDDVGFNSILMTATDFSGNSSDCSATIIVLDEVPPVALCKDITVELDKFGNTSITESMIDDGSSDACRIANLALSKYDFACEDVGNNTVVLTATDQNNNISNCSAVVTVEDNELPSAICQDITVQLDENGQAFIGGSNVDGGSSDACGIASLVVSLDAFTCADHGENTVVLTVTDVNANSNCCTATVTVEDNVAPEITLCQGYFVDFNGEETLLSSIGINFEADDACGVASITYAPEYISCEQLGSTVPVTITVTDIFGNSNNCVANVDVVGLPCGWNDFGDDGLGCVGGNDVDYDVPSETFTMTSGGCYSNNFAADAAAYAKYDLCGDVEIIAHVGAISPFGQGWAGIAIRESEAPGSKKVALATNLSNFVRREIRTTTDAYAIPQQVFRPQATWLKLVRTGNQFVGSVSSDGYNWQIILVTSVSMNACIQAGLFVTNINNSSVTATFDEVEINGSGNQNLATLPVPTESLDQQQEMLLDFTIYPNPAQDWLRLDLTNYHEQKVQILIINQLGQTVLQYQVERLEEPSIQLVLENLISGTYFVKVSTDQEEQVKKLLIYKE